MCTPFLKKKKNCRKIYYGLEQEKKCGTNENNNQYFADNSVITVLCSSFSLFFFLQLFDCIRYSYIRFLFAPLLNAIWLEWTEQWINKKKPIAMNAFPYQDEMVWELEDEVEDKHIILSKWAHHHTFRFHIVNNNNDKNQMLDSQINIWTAANSKATTESTRST